MFNSVNLKLGNAKKVQNYVIYPYKGEGTITLQSDTRIARVDMDGKGIVSNPHASGAYFHHLVFEQNPIQLTEAEIMDIKLKVLGSGKKLEYGGVSAEQSMENITL